MRDVSKLVRTLRFSPVGFSAEVVGFSAGRVEISADLKGFPRTKLVRTWLDLVRDVSKLVRTLRFSPH